LLGFHDRRGADQLEFGDRHRLGRLDRNRGHRQQHGTAWQLRRGLVEGQPRHGIDERCGTTVVTSSGNCTVYHRR
jgi:hypothetical protein